METVFDAGVNQNFIELDSVVNITGAIDGNTTTESAPVLDLRTFERFRYVYYITVNFRHVFITTTLALYELVQNFDKGVCLCVCVCV